MGNGGKSMVKLNKILLVTLLLSVLLCGCNNSQVVEEDTGKEEIMTGLGVPLDELRSDMQDFILKTYMPSENDTKEDYIESIVKYLSENEYDTILSEIGDYNSEVRNGVRDLQVYYGLAANNSDNLDKILCSFYLNKTYNNETIRNKIDLIFLIRDGKIYSHTIYTSNTERRVS